MNNGDPVFAAIESHRRAHTEWSIASIADTPDQARIEALQKAEAEALDNLVQIVPTSIAGCAELVRYVAGQKDREWIAWWRVCNNVGDALSLLR